ncbi:hypothetical protein BDZ94DRAFT_1239676 [Collybia nuda]|uniref:Uncharacterized protein n=1 Tax=Collybia nuda TaxID=64659 RepID=A0A9P6CFD1_9AGAR|nr:hypothetical protein BDZ94DRAFT_1239676 [Collybia nuda]
MFMERPAFDLLSAENSGPVVIGFAISLLLFGTVITQGYTYFQFSPNDRLCLKTLAGTVLEANDYSWRLLEVAHSFLITYAIYHYLVTLRGFSPNGPNSYQLVATSIPASLISALVQGFFAFRIYRISGTLYTCIICWFLFLLRLGGTLSVSVEAFFDVSMVPNTITVLSKFDWLITLAFVIGAVGDVIIAASFCYYLKRLAPQEGFRTLMLAIIQTGMLTRCLAFSYVVHTLYDQYQTLNMRRGLREKYTPGIDISQLQFPVIVTSGNPLEDHNTILHLTKVLANTNPEG